MIGIYHIKQAGKNNIEPYSVLRGKKQMENKYIPQVGEKLYLRQLTGNCMVDMVKEPYTVIKVTPKNVFIQRCKLIFNGPRYYNTLADRIEEDLDGDIRQLNWAPKKQRWQIDEYKTGYPEIAVFGSWQYQPYLD